MTKTTITVLDNKAKEAGSVSAFESLATFEVKPQLLAEVIRSELSNLRTGNAHTKTKSEVRGGGRKPWKQKGTGRARHGSIRSPIWKGGGITFGPRNTVNWTLKINKTARIAALKSVIKDRLSEDHIFQFKKPAFTKTNVSTDFIEVFIKNHDMKSKHIAVIYDTQDKENLRGFVNTDVALINVNNVKIHKLANNVNFIFTENSLKILEEKLK
jgi:large subunit ribosomal protein L4